MAQLLKSGVRGNILDLIVSIAMQSLKLDTIIIWAKSRCEMRWMLGRVVRRDQSSLIAMDGDRTKKNPQILRCPYCKSSSIAIELTFAPPQINKR